MCTFHEMNSVVSRNKDSLPFHADLVENWNTYGALSYISILINWFSFIRW